MAFVGLSRPALWALFAGVVASLPGFAARADMAHVIELFTSQGCSSCPPADRLIAERARDPHIVAISFPVDTWDYIGWKDTFASSHFTERQKAYARARGDDQVYTPQVVVDGRKAEIGSDAEAIDRTVAVLGQASAMTVPLTLREAGGRLHVAVGAGDGPAAGVYVLRVLRSRTVEIGRGENSGHTLTYTNVVRAMSKLGEWSGKAAEFDMVELKGDDEGYVVLLQCGDAGKPAAILAAAKTPGF